MERQHRLFGEPADPEEVAGSSGFTTIVLALATVTQVKMRILDVKPTCPFAFDRDNEIVASPSSDATEQKRPHFRPEPRLCICFVDMGTN